MTFLLRWSPLALSSVPLYKKYEFSCISFLPQIKVPNIMLLKIHVNHFYCIETAATEWILSMQ